MNTALQTGEALHEAVQRCRQAQLRWREVPVRQRLRPIRTLRGLLVAECDRLCEATEKDIGKPPAETIGAEVLPLADALRFLEREASAILRPHRIPRRSRPLSFWGQSDTVHRRPRGIVGIIGTWNYPLMLNGVQMAQALVAGNGVVWKPSEVAPASAEVLFDLVLRAGFPEGLAHRMEATREGGSALVEAAIDHLVFTGGASVGRQIATRLGQRLISSTMELSGCDALFVLSDADVGLAARAAWFGFTLNRGQTCIGVRRAFVHRSVYQAFIEALRAAAEAIEPVRLALASQVSQAEQLIAEAVERGGRVLGARETVRRDDRLFRPTVVIDVHTDMELCREASFAPLLAVMPFDSLEEALQANAVCPYGLGASIFTLWPGAGEELAGRLRTGFVTINDVIAPVAHPATPFGGLGDSGWGETQGAEGLLALTVPQVVSVKGGTFRPHYDLSAGGPADSEAMVRGLLHASHGRSLRERWRGFWQMLRGLRRRPAEAERPA